MRKLSNVQYAIVNLLGIALGMDKKSYDERLKYAEEHDWKAEISKIAICDWKGESTIEQAEIIEAVKMHNEVKKGSTNKKMWIDMSCSGATLHEILTKMVGTAGFAMSKYASASGSILQELVMKGNLSIVGKDIVENRILDLYTYMFEEYKKECEKRGISALPDGMNQELTRKELKKGIIPWFYNGEKTMKGILGEDRLEIFREVYARLLPGSEGFRKATLEGWDETKYSYYWEGPDGAQIEFCVLGDNQKMQAYVEKGWEMNYVLVENEPRKFLVDDGNGHLYINAGVRCLGANLTHSTDRYVLMETARRVHMTRAHALEIIKNSETAENKWEDDEQLKRLYRCYKRQNIVSVRWLYLVEEKKATLPEDVKEELVRIAEEELGNKVFDIMVIHDAFGCVVNHMNRLRQTVNYVLASLYKSTIVEYWNEELGLDIPVGEFREDMYEMIKNADYLMC